MSVEAGLRTEVLPALSLCECAVDVFSTAGGDSWHTHSSTERPHSMDYVPSNIEVSITRAHLSVFEDSEAVIETSIYS